MLHKRAHAHRRARHLQVGIADRQIKQLLFRPGLLNTLADTRSLVSALQLLCASLVLAAYLTALTMMWKPNGFMIELSGPPDRAERNHSCTAGQAHQSV